MRVPMDPITIPRDEICACGRRARRAGGPGRHGRAEVLSASPAIVYRALPLPGWLPLLPLPACARGFSTTDLPRPADAAAAR